MIPTVCPKNKHDVMILLIDQPASVSLLKFHLDHISLISSKLNLLPHATIDGSYCVPERATGNSYQCFRFVVMLRAPAVM